MLSAEYRGRGRRYPVRMFGFAPSGLKKASEVSFGPFPVDRQVYERCKQNLPSDGAFRAFLGFVRLSYEKTGGLMRDYRFAADDEGLTTFIGLMRMWDVHHPAIYGDIFWILPNDEAKRTVEDMSGKKFRVRDSRWWNIRLDLGKAFKATTADDYPDEFSLIPTELTGPWARYLPMQTYLVICRLYLKMTRGGKLKPFSALETVLQSIEEAIDIEGSKPELTGSSFDRELLIKELCEYNGLTYPVDPVTTLEFLQQTAFVQVAQAERQVQYSLAPKVLSPRKLLKIPRKWETRMDTFLKNNSALFSYLTIDEIIGGEA